MKVRIIRDTLADGLDRQINDFIQHKHVIDIKLNTCTDDEVNSFIQNHDVIKVENFGTNSEEVTTVLTYRETKK